MGIEPLQRHRPDELRTLFLDFETFFGPVPIPGEFTGKRVKKQKMLNLSLKNNTLSLTDYVRHPEFEVLGVAARWEDENGSTFYRANEVRGFLESVDWSTTRVVAHHAHFDGLVLFEIYGIVPAQYFCTMACAEAIYQGALPSGLDALAKVFGVGEKSPDLMDFRGLHAKDIDQEGWDKLARYGNNDANIMFELYYKLEDGLTDDEKELMNLTIMLFANPVMVIDVGMSREALADAEHDRDTLVAKTGLTKEQISGNISFESALRNRLGWVPTKLNAKGEVKPAFAKTDLEFVTLKSHPDEVVRALVEARQEVKSSLNITRAERLITLGTTGTCLANICLYYARAHTMRWTGGNKMNPQNFTRGSKLRLSLKAPPGYVLAVVDSSQIEARVLATLAGQNDLVEVFRTGQDPYAIMATKVYGYEVSKDENSPHYHPIERFMGKTMVLGLGYGMGWRKFYNEIKTGNRGMALDIEPEFAQRAVNIYRDANDKIMAFHKTAESWLWYMVNDHNPIKKVKNGLITLDPKTKRVIFPNGCYLRYPELSNDEGDLMYKAWNVKTKRYEWKKIYGGLFVENIVQALARHIVATQILEIAKRYRCVLFVHDECVYCVPEELAEEAVQFGIDEFRRLPWWIRGLLDVPLDSEGGFDVSYSK